MKMLQMGWPKLERAVGVEKAFDHLHDSLKLPETILNFRLRYKLRVADQFGLKSLAVPNLVGHYRLSASVFRSSSCSSTISRVMRSFSIFVLPYAKLRRCA